jgi:hypothetical protein
MIKRAKQYNSDVRLRKHFEVTTDLRKHNCLPEYFSKEIWKRQVSLDNTFLPFTEKARIDESDFLDITSIDLSYQNTCTDLRGIEKLVNLETFYIIGAAADMTSLSKCLKLKEIIIGDPCLINDLEALIDHPSLRILRLYGCLTNYDENELQILKEKFRHLEEFKAQLRV